MKRPMDDFQWDDFFKQLSGLPLKAKLDRCAGVLDVLFEFANIDEQPGERDTVSCDESVAAPNQT